MVEREIEPLNHGSARPPKGRMTWIGLGAILLFVVVLLAVVVRPLLGQTDGPETPGASASPADPPRQATAERAG